MEYSLRPSQQPFCPRGLPDEQIMWNHGVAIVFHKKYSYQQLNGAFNTMIQSCEELRLQLIWQEGTPKLRIAAFTPVQYPYVFFHSREELMEATEHMIDQSFELSDVLFRCVVFETLQESGFLISAHHMLIDGYSVQVMADLIEKILRESGQSAVPVLPYVRQVEVDMAYRSSARYRQDVLYWQEQLPKLSSASIFASEKYTGGYACEELVQVFPSDLFRQVVAFCHENGISIFTFFSTALGIWAQREFEISSFVPGIPVLGRTTQAQLTSPGLHMNILPMIVELSDSSFLKCVKKNELHKMDLFRHQRFTRTDVENLPNFVREIHNNLYDVVFDYQEFPENAQRELLFFYSKALSVPLEIHLHNHGHLQKVYIRYRTALFSSEQIRDFWERFVCIATAAVGHPQFPPEKLPQFLLSTEQRQTLLANCNCTQYTYTVPEDSTLYSLFTARAAANANEVCITAGGRSLTFQQLDRYAETLDGTISQITGGRKSVIAVIVERSLEMYVAIFGIIRGGNAYLPIDPAYPPERITYILRNSGAVAVMAQQSFCSLAGEVPCIDVTQFLKNPTPSVPALPVLARVDDVAYVIYTSGSTGNPKGVMISHRSAVNRILWMQDAYPLESTSVILQKTPYTFDVSVWELFWWGMCGGRMAASAPGEHFLPQKILQDVYAYQVTHLHFVPSVFDIFLTYLEQEPHRQTLFKSVKHVFLSGESLSASLIRRFYAMFSYPTIRLHNLYGPTECAVDVTYYDCKPDDDDPVPIGRPIYNTYAYVCDQAMNLLPLGKQGELCIGGLNVGKGYLNEPELTAERFVDNPFGQGKLYKTGDQASIRPDGQILFHGRMDGQIKINGQRVEIHEIEFAIRNVPGVESSVVIPYQRGGRTSLFGFYSGHEGLNDLIEYTCRQKLPSYMVPTGIYYLAQLPLNRSGKLDRCALQEILSQISTEQIYEPPCTSLEELICLAFSEVLHCTPVSRSSNFFDLGGDSLDMITLLSREEFEKITPGEFIAHPTPAALAEFLQVAPIQKGCLQLLRKGNSWEKALVLFPYAGGEAESFAAFVQSASHMIPDFSLFYAGFPQNVEDCKGIAQELEDLRGITQLYFYSHCAGNAVALQVLRILEQEAPGIVRHYIAAASIPPAQPIQENIWNAVSDGDLRKILQQAGAVFDGLPDSQIRNMLTRFRRNTDFYTDCFGCATEPITTPLSLILSKQDMFTENYEEAQSHWQQYASELRGVHFINSASHYFQADRADDLLREICTIIEI